MLVTILEYKQLVRMAKTSKQYYLSFLKQAQLIGIAKRNALPSIAIGWMPSRFNLVDSAIVSFSIMKLQLFLSLPIKSTQWRKKSLKSKRKLHLGGLLFEK
uniref:Predicted protein n=1 Tax=Hordeum vulgare subsp. vulgare TaxID=112509 RepID=F2DZZ2_HORVV|nr:predicted protein [Hordeum vulgare subsp. vulgare]